MYDVLMSDSSGSSNFFGKILEGLRIRPKELKKLPFRKMMTSRLLALTKKRGGGGGLGNGKNGA